jgi:hypothetical protein
MLELTTEQKIEQVSAKWIIEMMNDYEIKNPRQLSILANISEASLNRTLKGHREPSSEIKNTLYWFFLSKSYERQIQEFNR